jgi:hypothetical protein
MSIAFVTRHRLSHGSHSAAARLLASALACLFLAAHAARAEEAPRSAIARFAPSIDVWVCADHKASPHHGRPPIEMTLKDGLLIEQPLGSPRYLLLADNDHAIIGVDYHADFEPVLGTVNIFVSTVTIDKSTGNFAIAVTAGDKVTEHRSGRCRKFEHVTPGNDTMLAQRK